MAFKLSRGEDRRFGGRIGEVVEIGVSPQGQARLVRISYAGEEDGTAPFQFTIREGLHALVVAPIGVLEPQKIFITEKDGIQVQDLTYFSWSSATPIVRLAIVGRP